VSEYWGELGVEDSGGAEGGCEAEGGFLPVMIAER
jgi:hypothetical protein